MYVGLSLSIEVNINNSYLRILNHFVNIVLISTFVSVCLFETEKCISFLEYIYSFCNDQKRKFFVNRVLICRFIIIIIKTLK